jgi:hypothetical protein
MNVFGMVTTRHSHADTAHAPGDDSREEVVRRADWRIGEDGYRRRMECPGARPARPPAEAAARPGRFFRHFDQENQDAQTLPCDFRV